MDIIYKKADENDAYGIEYVSAYSWKETYSGLLPDNYLDDRIKNIPNKVEKMKQFLKNYTGDYIVAKDGNNVIGILAYRASYDDKYKEYGYLEALYVLKEYQGLGIGKELFRQAIIGLRKMGYNKMMLECMTGNHTLAFYQKYCGIISENTDYQIKNVGLVKVDIILFDNLDKVFEKINEETSKLI